MGCVHGACEDSVSGIMRGQCVRDHATGAKGRHVEGAPDPTLSTLCVTLPPLPYA